jgi:hypothetical protein
LVKELELGLEPQDDVELRKAEKRRLKERKGGESRMAGKWRKGS